jgi:hypothetical protein
MKREILAITTDVSGNATVNGTRNILGLLYAILYLPGTIATGATIVVTSQGAIARPLLTKANAGTSDTVFFPRDLVHAVADGAALTGTAGGDRALPLIFGKLRVVVSSGGSGGIGSLIAIYGE